MFGIKEQAVAVHGDAVTFSEIADIDGFEGGFGDGGDADGLEGFTGGAHGSGVGGEPQAVFVYYSEVVGGFCAFAFLIADDHFFAASPAGDDADADFDEAAAVARAEGKDLFVDFTGSDWCGWCIRLHDEVFQYDTFLEPVAENYILVALDFPNGEEAKAAVPNPERNDELQRKYQIAGFPTILIMNPDGDVFAQMGYAEGGPEKYVESMTASVAIGREMLTKAGDLETAFAAAEGDARIALMGDAIALLEKAAAAESTIGWERVAPIAEAALELEGEAYEDLKLRAVGALLGGTPDQALFEMAYELDATNEKGLFERALMAEMGSVRDDVGAAAFTEKVVQFATTMTAKDSEACASMMTTAAVWNEQFLGNHDTAVLLANHAMKLQPEMEPTMAATLQAILQVETVEEAPAEEVEVEEEPVRQG